MPTVAIRGSSVATGHLCDTTTILDTPGQSTVFAGSKLIACLGDPTVVHQIKIGDDCVPHVASISGHSSSVYINGIAVSRIGDACDAGSITSGEASVSIG